MFSSIANYFGKAAGAAVKWLWEQIESATAVSLTGPGLKTDLEASGAVAALIATCLFLIQLIAAMLRQEPGGLLRAVRGLGVAFIGAAMAIGSTQILLGAIDALSNGVVKFATGTNVRGMGAKLVAGEALSGGNPAGVLLMSLVLLAAVVVVWCAMMIRKMLIIVSAVFAPIAFAGSAADITKGWVRKWIEFTVALAFSKLVLVIMFMIGLSVLNGAGQAGGGAGQNMTQLAIGALVLLLAGFAPWLAIKFVHFAGDSFVAGHAQAVAATAGARTVVASPQKVSSMGQRAAVMKSQADSWSSPAGTPTSVATTPRPRHEVATTTKGAAAGAGPAGAAAAMTIAGWQAATNRIAATVQDTRATASQDRPSPGQAGRPGGKTDPPTQPPKAT